MMSKRFANVIEKIYDFTENSKLLQSIRNGLVMIIPILLIGSFSIVLRSLPIAAYQDFVHNFGGGVFYNFFSFLYNGTLGFFGVYLTISISICYAQQYQEAQSFNYGATITSLIVFCIFSGILQEDFAFSSFGAQGAFTAIVSALGASSLYCLLEKRMFSSFRFFADGADEEFNRAIATFFPIAIITLLFATINMFFVKIFHVTGFQMFFSETLNHLFDNMGRSLGTMLLFVALSNIMWFFGIHGNDVLEPVSQHIFVPAIEINQQLIQSGAQATEIFSKTFYDAFALMGGSGNTISLFLALLLFSKRRNNKKLVHYAALPMLINVNELLVFGLPVVFNPILLIPFVLTPIVLVLISSFAIQMGLVPVPYTTVEWTTPVILGGYLATGSILGSILQIVNIAIGVLIYLPFVRMYDKEKDRDVKKRMDGLVHILQKSEEEDKQVELLSLRTIEGNVAKSVVEDIRYRLSKELPKLYYQPQFDRDGNCIGAEALLRWTHPTFGMLYPPLVVKLAGEAKILHHLEQSIFRSVLQDMPTLLETIGEEGKISVNVTGTTIQTEEFEHFLKGLREGYPDLSVQICIEITEQTALKFDDKLIERLTRIHEMGFSLAIDDFSMGSTSIKYLQTSVFDLVKLDGALSRNVLNNPRSKEIIASIAGLTQNFGIQVLAEYVETEDQRKALEEIGCYQYQGYLYSPAVPVEELKKCCKRVVRGDKS